jgi:DNA-binding NtrC family response regulator
MQRVLVIDRDVDFINATRTVLEEMGFELEIALQGGTGVEIVTNRRIDLVLLGLDNLETPGPDLLQRVKEAKPGIPILAAVENVARYKMLDDLGDRVAGYIPKPLDPNQLQLEVEKALSVCTETR